jgi:nucleotide-binding universal stress UspA family protein
LDGSRTSERALRVAIRLARESGARLRLVHVVDELVARGAIPSTPGDFWKAVRAAGSRILDNARARAARDGVKAETKLAEIRSFGSLVTRVPSVIVEEARRWRADLIVIGTHGRRGLSKLLLGSVADGVVRTSGTSVLLIRGAGRTARRAR